MTKRAIIHFRIHYCLAIAIAFSLPLARLSGILIGLLFFNWIIEGDFKNKFKTIYQNKYALLFASLYMIHVIGLIYTQNSSAARFDMEVKSALLVFPLLIVSRNFNLKQFNSIFYAFIVGEIVSSFIMLFIATKEYFTTGFIHFFYEEFSVIMHPSYLSMYINISSAFLILNLITGKYTTKISKILAASVVIFFIGITILLSSKMGLLCMIILLLSFLVYYIVSRKKYWVGIIGIFAIALMFLGVIKFLPDVTSRITRSLYSLTAATPNNTETESTAVRLLVWKAARNVISQNFMFGAGTGDAKDVLLVEYAKEGLTGALENKLNTHNTFYQIFVALGLIGFILLLLNLFAPLIFAYKAKNALYFIFLCLMILNFLPESMLETQAGVMFFAFFNSLLCFKSNNQQLTTTN